MAVSKSKSNKITIQFDITVKEMQVLEKGKELFF